MLINDLTSNKLVPRVGTVYRWHADYILVIKILLLIAHIKYLHYTHQWLFWFPFLFVVVRLAAYVWAPFRLQNGIVLNGMKTANWRMSWHCSLMLTLPWQNVLCTCNDLSCNRTEIFIFAHFPCFFRTLTASCANLKA